MNIRLGLKIIQRILFDRDRKSLSKIYKDINWIKRKSPFKNKEIQHYFDCLIYKKDAGKVSNYLPRKVFLDFKQRTRHYKYKGFHPILGNKRKFKELMVKKGIPSPTYIGKLWNQVVTLPDGCQIYTNNYSEISALISEWSYKFESVFIKKVDSQSGKDVYEVRDLGDFKDINFDSDKEYIIEAKIKQIEAISKFNSNCVLSLRVITVFKNDRAHILNSYFRTGFGNSSVDNASAGGIMIRYDIFKNKLDRVGYQKWKFGGKSYLKHPNTGFEFKDKPLPFPDEVIKLVKNAATIFPEKELVGWDIAFTEKGPLLMEGNDNPAIISMQITFKGLLNNKHFKLLYNEYFKPDGSLKSESHK